MVEFERLTQTEELIPMFIFEPFYTRLSFIGYFSREIWRFR